MSLGAAFLGGLVSEWNKMTEEQRIAQAEKEKTRQAAEVADAVRKQELEDQKDILRFEQQLKDDEFYRNRGFAYSDINSRKNVYKSQGINAYFWVDKDNVVQEKIFDDKFPGWKREEADRLREEFLADPFNTQGDKLRGARVIPVTGTEYYNLEYFDIEKPKPSSDPKAATAFMNNAKTDPAFSHLNVGIKQTDSGDWINTFELKSKTPLRVTRADLQKQLPNEQKAYPDYDVFIVGKPGEATFSYVKKERVADYASAQASARKIEADFPYLKVLIDGSDEVGYTVRTVEKNAPLFETREQAKTAADKAATENPDYDFIVIGNNNDGWGYEVRAPKDVKEVVGIDDPNVADQDFSTAVTYSSNYFVFASQGTFDLGEKAIDRGAITIPLTKAADDAIARPSSAMKALKDKKGRAWTVFVPPKQGDEAAQPDAFMRELRKTFSPELVKKLVTEGVSRRGPSVNPDRAVQVEAYNQFVRLLNQGVNQYIRGTTQVLGEKTAFDIPENVSMILNEYRGINGRIDKIIEDTFDTTQEEILAENDMILDQTPDIEVVETGEPVPMPAGEDGITPSPQPAVATRVVYTRYPNVQSSSLVDPIVDAEGNATGGYYLKPSAKEVIVKAAINAGFINPENGEPQTHRVLGILNSAKEPGGVQGKKSVEAAFNSLVKLQEFFSPEMRTMKSRPAGTGSVRTFTEPMDTTERDELATYLDVFPDHMSRVNAIRMAIPKTAVASRRARRKSDSPEAILSAVSGGMNLKRISEEGAVARKALDLTTSITALFEPASGPAAQFGVAADILRMRQAAGYIFQNVIGNLDVNNDFGETREELQNRLRADFAEIPDGDTRQSRNALARFLMENLTYVNASMNDPNGRLSEGDRIQSQTALGVAMFFTSPGEIMPIVRLIREKAEYVSFFGAAVDSGSPELVMSTVIYDQNYKAGRLDEYVSYITGVAQERQGDALPTDTSEADAELAELEGLEGGSEEAAGLANEGVGQRALTLEELALDTNNDGIVSDEERQAGEQNR